MDAPAKFYEEKNKLLGKVFLVGAGPGDLGLLTVRGREILEDADTVVYDHLVGDGVLALMPRDAKLVNAGKENGHHSISQREIEQLLISEAQAGKKVVRLKGGDPFLFGRGGEEILAISSAKIPWEIVPGITSAIAAPECAGIPVTHRGLTNAVHIHTSHSAGETDENSTSFAQGTHVFLMGVASLPKICAKLRAEGLSAETPAAAIENGTTAHQRTICGTLETLPEKAVAQNLKPPAIIIVGSAVTLAEKCAPPRLPLSGKKVIVTRPADRQAKLSHILRDRGAEVVEFPVIATVPLKNSLPSLDDAGWIAFTSASGIEYFFDALARENRDIREIADAKIAAIGPATAECLRTHGLKIDLIPQNFNGAALARELAARARGTMRSTSPGFENGEKILIFRAQDGSPDLTEILRESGAIFEEIPIYRTEFLPAPFVPHDADAVIFTSASSVRAFRAACPDFEISLACCIGEATAREAERAGIKNIRIASRATIEDLADTLL